MSRLWWLLLAIPIGLLVVMAGLTPTIGGSTRAAVVHVNAEADVPSELHPMFAAQAQLYGIEWPWFAAYISYRWGWDLPIPSRLDRLLANRDHNYQLRQHPCHPESFHPAPPPEPPTFPDAPPPPHPCDDYSAPPDRTTDRQQIETEWEIAARTWLDQQLFSLFGVATGDALIALPAPRDVRERIRSRVSPDAWRAIDEHGQLYSEFYSALAQEPELRVIADWEDATVFLRARDWEYAFPVAGGAQYRDDWGEPRPQNTGYGSTRHQGTDLFAPPGTSLEAVTNGVVYQAGWNRLGGWTVTIRGEDGLLYYYAHLQAPSPFSEGATVSRGEQIGLLGDTGQGPEGTAGEMVPHLHFGIYIDEKHVINPYPYLRFWQEHPPDELRCPSRVC